MASVDPFVDPAVEPSGDAKGDGGEDELLRRNQYEISRVWGDGRSSVAEQQRLSYLSHDGSSKGPYLQSSNDEDAHATLLHVCCVLRTTCEDCPVLRLGVRDVECDVVSKFFARARSSARTMGKTLGQKKKFALFCNFSRSKVGVYTSCRTHM